MKKRTAHRAPWIGAFALVAAAVVGGCGGRTTQPEVQVFPGIFLEIDPDDPTGTRAKPFQVVAQEPFQLGGVVNNSAVRDVRFAIVQSPADKHFLNEITGEFVASDDIARDETVSAIIYRTPSRPLEDPNRPGVPLEKLPQDLPGLVAVLENAEVVYSQPIRLIIRHRVLIDPPQADVSIRTQFKFNSIVKGDPGVEGDRDVTWQIEPGGAGGSIGKEDDPDTSVDERGLYTAPASIVPGGQLKDVIIATSRRDPRVAARAEVTVITGSLPPFVIK